MSNGTTGLAAYLSRRAEELRRGARSVGGQGKQEQKPPVVVLEIGAGTGELAHHLKCVVPWAMMCLWCLWDGSVGGWVGVCGINGWVDRW